MRKTADRIRHAISFELIGLGLVIPLGTLAFAMPAKDIGVVGVVGATLATFWNYIYNLGFDHLLRRLTGTTLKTVSVRIVHAVLFEAGLLMILMPFIAWYLQISLWQAFVMDVAFALFYLVYAFVFNWAYDRVFPLPEWKTEKAPAPQ
ncbi:PACE efflux transporter [Allorhizobium sp. NPDC080224]